MAVCPGAALAADHPAAADRLVYTTPAGVAWEVTAEGLSAIRAGGRELAHGGWSAWNAEGWFKDGGTGKVKTATLQDKGIAIQRITWLTLLRRSLHGVDCAAPTCQLLISLS